VRKFIVGSVAVVLLTTACAKARNEYKLTTEQDLELKNAQLEARNIKIQLDVVQEQFNVAMAHLQSTATNIILKNKWSPNTQFDPNTLKFSDAPTVPTPKDIKK
jgi:hypothetical protein